MKLDQYQEQVVNSPKDANMLVVGSPGSGKTLTLVTRYAHLYINGGLQPSRILALTFSKKASDEMRKRIGKMVDLNVSGKRNISTINAFCYRLYNDWRESNEMTPLKVWQYGDRQQNPMFKASELMQNHLKSSDLSLFDLINKTLKSEPKPTSELLKPVGFSNERSHQAYRMWVEYEKWMKKNNLVDFYGQVWNVDRLLHKNPIFAMMTGQMFDKILADEVQDMFPQTYRILLKLAEESSIELYGDPSQSIYGFNGAAPHLFYEVEALIKDPVTYYLSNNYRSHNNIVELVNDFGPKTSKRFSEMICVNAKKTGNVKIGTVDTISDQADYIADEIRAKDFKYNDVYVLARTNGQCLAIYQRLLQLGIPANYVGNFSVWDRSHIKAGVSYLAITKDQDSPEDLGNVLNIPSEDYVNSFGVCQGRYSPTRFLARAAFSAFSYADLASGKFTATRPQRTGVSNLMKFISKLKGLETDRQRVGDIGAAISKWAQWSGKDHFQVEDDLAMLWDKMENLDYDVNKFRIYVQKMTETKRKIKPDSNKVEVMTIHQSKGLEANIVFLTGLSQPDNRGTYKDNSSGGSGFHPGRNTNPNINEENCLYYVGVSRAIEYLYLLHYKESGDILYKLSDFVTLKTKRLAKWHNTVI